MQGFRLGAGRPNVSGQVFWEGARGRDKILLLGEAIKFGIIIILIGI